jgi:hypothetical protein
MCRNACYLGSAEAHLKISRCACGRMLQVAATVAAMGTSSINAPSCWRLHVLGAWLQPSLRQVLSCCPSPIGVRIVDSGPGGPQPSLRWDVVPGSTVDHSRDLCSRWAFGYADQSIELPCSAWHSTLVSCDFAGTRLQVCVDVP